MSADLKSWNLACLHGSVKGYERGTVPLRRVNSWAERALRLGASMDEVRDVLAPHGLELSFELTVKAPHDRDDYRD